MNHKQIAISKIEIYEDGTFIILIVLRSKDTINLTFKSKCLFYYYIFKIKEIKFKNITKLYNLFYSEVTLICFVVFESLSLYVCS